VLEFTLFLVRSSCDFSGFFKLGREVARQEEALKHALGHNRTRQGKHGRGHHMRNLKEALEYRSEKFTRYDTNDDGVIDAAEAREKGSKRREYYKRRCMHVLDTNKDGSVSKDEYLAKPKEHFSMMDLDGDGAITADDLPPRMARRWKEKNRQAALIRNLALIRHGKDRRRQSWRSLPQNRPCAIVAVIGIRRSADRPWTGRSCSQRY